VVVERLLRGVLRRLAVEEHMNQLRASANIEFAIDALEVV
jgi:hypothetical protein